MKKTLGLDLGTNSIGWALVGGNDPKKKIAGIGVRTIPMGQDVLGKFDNGQSISQTAERTSYRGIRRLRERSLLRRERLHRVLGLMGFLPKHYEASIDRFGKLKDHGEPKLAWKQTAHQVYEFIFQSSFHEMVVEFKALHPELFAPGANGVEKKIPYDHTIYYLRKKALTRKIEKEELAWLLLNFNRKRGYYQLRGEEEEHEKPNKLVEFHALRVVDVTEDEPQKGKSDIWYNVVLENGWVYRRSSRTPLHDWKGKVKEFIVTTDLNDDGSVKKDKDGNETRFFRAPAEGDWTLLKKKTEADIDKSGKTVGTYIYDALLRNPTQKINGRFVCVIERRFYKEELKAILEKQTEFHPELQDRALYGECLNELYPSNESHRKLLQNADFSKLFLDDILFYQRPLKSKKSLISNCPYESLEYKDSKTGETKKSGIKCIAKSHPLFQEFRLWQFIKNIKIYEREKVVDGKLHTDVDVTVDFLKSEDDYAALFDWLNDKKEIKQDALLKSHFKIKAPKSYRWNYVEDKEYPCNETRSQMLNRLAKVDEVPAGFLNKETEAALWHILYSVEDKIEIEKALASFAKRHNLNEAFVAIFKKFPPFKKEYGSYSAKAIKKLLPLMRLGTHWNESDIDVKTGGRIEKIIHGEFDDQIRDRVREKALNLTDISYFRGLPLWLACYIVYDRHSEAGDLRKWESPADVDMYLREFKQHSLRNPIVEQVITETLRVVRDIWEKHGDFEEIHVELGREMKNPADKRKEITERISRNENTNLRIKSLLMELSNNNDIDNVRPYSPSQQEILRIYEDGVLNSGIEIPEDIGRITKQSNPSKSDLQRYKLWLEQKYRSPYTGEIIPLSKLFTPAYEIEHIIPQSRFFDDSFSNKVICETAVNKDKDNLLAYIYIKNNSGKKIELGHGKEATLFTIESYEEFVKKHYNSSRSKMKKLLLEDIPESFIERQMNDTRYISRVIMGLLSNIVRADDEQEATSKNVILCNGEITAKLKREWGLGDVWNEIIAPRFERMNEITQTNRFGTWTNKNGKRVFQTDMPLELQKGFNKKRIDHRHHAMDALVIACASRNHVNYLNNKNAAEKDAKEKHELKHTLCYRTKVDDRVRFHKPWDGFTQDARTALEGIVVSFKQNLRVVNKTVNRYQRFENGEKITATQTKGDRWAIRKPLHKDTVSGAVNIRFTKQVALATGIDQWEALVDKKLKAKIGQLRNEGLDKKKIVKFFAGKQNEWMGHNVSRVEIYYFSNDKEELVASRVSLDATFNPKKIETITDSGIRKIALKHLEQNDGNPGLAFSPEGIDEMNRNIIALNGGKPHKPIHKVRTYETRGKKIKVGSRGNKKDKFVEAAKGTNLFFAVYADDEGKRSYDTIPLNDVIERLKQGLREVPETNGKGAALLFSLSPNDLVYVPTAEETENGILYSDLDPERIYKTVSCTGNQCHFIPHVIASPVVQTTELGANNKAERAWSGEQIKSSCLKLSVDRLGNITGISND